MEPARFLRVGMTRGLHKSLSVRVNECFLRTRNLAHPFFQGFAYAPQRVRRAIACAAHALICPAFRHIKSRNLATSVQGIRAAALASEWRRRCV